MASSGLCLHRHLVCIHSPKTNYSSYNFQAFIRSPNCLARLRTVPKSSPRKHASSSPESEIPPREPKSAPSRVPIDPDPQPTSPLSHSFSSFAHRLRDGFKFDELGLEILTIALPAALALAADPIASLVDTRGVHLVDCWTASVFGLVGTNFKYWDVSGCDLDGRSYETYRCHTSQPYRSVELAAVGVSVSVFNLVSKLFNVPLLNIITSYVAEEQALVSQAAEDSTQIDNDGMGEHDGN